MQLRMWMLDIAREQSPTLDHLRRYLDLTRSGGYNAIGLYLEHRFAYPSTPWAHGAGCVDPETIAVLESEYPDIQIVPFINLLGHFEGMLYTEYGKRFREERFKGLQACPSCPEFVSLCFELVEDTVKSFSSELIHIGGDETGQLAVCERCRARVAGGAEGNDGKAVLYGEHFGPLVRKVQELGRKPAVWGDMFLEHPEALAYMPKDVLIFDWQYFKSPLESSRKFRDWGFDVVCCPAIQTYNATWCHLAQSEANVRDSVEAVRSLDAHGVCVTTWECGLFGNYETLFPAVLGAGRVLHPSTPSSISGQDSGGQESGGQKTGEGALMAAYSVESEAFGTWARLMSEGLAGLGGMFQPGSIRSSLKCRLLLYSNPFLAWMHHAEELCGERGDQALAIFAEALRIAPTQATRGVAEFGKLAVEFVRYADQARQAYAQGLPGVAVASLTPCRQIFEQLERIAVAASLNIGGSKADIERCRAAREHVERVMLRIKEYGDGSLGYLPAFEIITHPKFMAHDQASWWLINKWANE
jgi:hypothetical protein